MLAQRLGGMVCVAALAWATPALAQTGGAPSTPSKIGARAFVHFEAQAMTAKDSFDAVMGTSTLKGLGGGGEVQGLWRGVFARIAVSRFRKTGERVFVFENEVFPLGIPLEVTMMPIEAVVGWRFKPLTSRAIVPYVAAGASFLKHREHTEGDSSGDDVNETYAGAAIFGGVEVPVWRFVSAGAEVGWRTAKVKSPGGAFGAFGEEDLGGVSMRVMLSIRK